MWLLALYLACGLYMGFMLWCAASSVQKEINACRDLMRENAAIREDIHELRMKRYR